MPTLTRKTGKQPTAGQFEILKSSALKKIPWLLHGFSTRNGGVTECYGGTSLNLELNQLDSPGNVARNRQLLLVRLGAGDCQHPWPLVTMQQIHSDLICIVDRQDPGKLVGDGLVTNIPNLALAIQTADCFPVLLVDKRNKAVGAFHAGWRGTAKRIVEKGLGVMRYQYGSRPEDVHAAIGAGIQRCCYAIGEEIRSEFESQFHYSNQLLHEVYSSDPVREKYPLLFMNARPPGHGDMGSSIHLDLAEANRRQLVIAGVPEDQISVLNYCTACAPGRFFSFRAEKGVTGRMMVVAGIRTSPIETRRGTRILDIPTS